MHESLSSNRPLRVLAIAYACNPYQGSEEGVGWGWVRMIAARHQVDVITASYHQADIERARSENPSELQNVRFHGVPARRWHYRPSRGWKRIEDSILKPLMNLAYSAWQRDAHRLACGLHRQTPFDVVHLITYVGFRFPGRFWQMDLPLVWGPVGGLTNTPWRFLPALGWRGAAYFAGRNFVNSVQKRLLIGPRRSFAKAAGGIIAATGGIQREILRCYGHMSQVICEIGPPQLPDAGPPHRAPGEPLRLAWSGNHVPGKALPLLFGALTRLEFEVDWSLDILGSGPRTRPWQRQAERLGLNPRCRWHGRLARQEAVAVLGRAHALVITSLHDLTSTVLLEALAQGIPVICPDDCGFADVVDRDCGVAIPLRSPSQFQADLACAVRRLWNDEGARRSLGEGAMRRVRAFSWEKKAEALEAIYRKVVRDRTGSR